MIRAALILSILAIYTLWLTHLLEYIRQGLETVIRGVYQRNNYMMVNSLPPLYMR
ncbi:MAG: hypothetical protein Q8O76_08495 [Chloroflexota bacterium]|nr:hypothetical protein [Chloroflexota bacterium]